MEAVEAFLDGEWDSLSKLFSCEDSDLLMHSNGSNFFSYDVENPLNFSDIDANVLLPSNTLDHNSCFYSVSQESGLRPVDFPEDLMEEITQLKAQMMCSDNPVALSKDADDSCEEMNLKRKFVDDHNPSETPKKKRARVTKEMSKRNTQSKKAKKASNASISNDENISSTCISEEDDCTASMEINGTSESTEKAKSSKSPATDPQSLYARKRRERINERLRILQNLVPNGTKVDISTMLEEAVHYVKFLQLQIKLLSSDDMWMYAPIAYNGMDMGLYQKIVPNP